MKLAAVLISALVAGIITHLLNGNALMAAGIAGTICAAGFEVKPEF